MIEPLRATQRRAGGSLTHMVLTERFHQSDYSFHLAQLRQLADHCRMHGVAARMKALRIGERPLYHAMTVVLSRDAVAPLQSPSKAAVLHAPGRFVRASDAWFG